MLATLSVNTIMEHKSQTKHLLSIHCDPCNESMAEPKTDHMGMTTAEVVPVADDELRIKSVVMENHLFNGHFHPEKMESRVSGLKSK